MSKPDDIMARLLAHEQACLAPFALHSADSGGRGQAEPEHPYRTCYQRDRDRIIHCAAFRRLDSKTQVFVPHEGDHHRTRMTHSLEVAQIARTLARALAANEDVAEAVALAHDLGHPPFGHAGEAALHELMAGHGGFEHNRQSLRVVDYLEHPYPDFRGLNLTYVVRLSLAKHTSRYDAPEDAEFRHVAQAPLEGQLVDLSDEIAYTSADLYDALLAGWLEPADLAGLVLWREAYASAQAAMPQGKEIHRRIRACANVVAMMVDDALEETRRRLEELRPARAADVQQARAGVAALSERRLAGVRLLQDLLMARVYCHPIARQNQQAGQRAIGGLFAAFLADPRRLPDRYQARIERDGLERVICDYIAGMTDRYCWEELERLEDMLDLEAIRAAKDEPTKPWPEVKKTLGL